MFVWSMPFLFITSSELFCFSVLFLLSPFFSSTQFNCHVLVSFHVRWNFVVIRLLFRSKCLFSFFFISANFSVVRRRLKNCYFLSEYPLCFHFDIFFAHCLYCLFLPFCFYTLCYQGIVYLFCYVRMGYFCFTLVLSEKFIHSLECYFYFICFVLVCVGFYSSSLFPYCWTPFQWILVFHQCHYISHPIFSLWHHTYVFVSTSIGQIHEMPGRYTEK